MLADRRTGGHDEDDRRCRGYANASVIYYSNVSTVSRINFGGRFRPAINCMCERTVIDYIQILYQPTAQSTDFLLSVQLDLCHAIFQSEVAFPQGAVNNMVQ